MNGIYQNTRKRYDTLSKEVDALNSERELLEKTSQVLKHLADKMVKSDLSSMDALVSYGLNTVFPHRDVCFQSNVIERGSKIWIELNTISNGEVDDPNDKSSIQVVESFILRILCMLKLKKFRFLYMDETFSAVGNDYIESLSKLIMELCRKLKLTVLLVTHNPSFLEYADNTYRITNENEKTEVVKTR